MAREGGEQTFVLGVLLVIIAYLVFGGAFTRHPSNPGYGGYGHVAHRTSAH